MKRIVLFSMSIIFCLLANAANIKRYVKEGGTGNGLTWETASGDLRAMLELASQVDQLVVLVGEGTYKGNFKIQSNTAFLGQFIGDDGYYNPNVCTKLIGHVTLEGGTMAYAEVQGSIRMNQAQLTKVKVYGADDIGVDVMQTSGKSKLKDCTFYQNGTGCRIYNGLVELENCSFCNNQYNGLFVRDGSVKARNCYFGENKGTGCSFDTPGSPASFSDCEFVCNGQGGFKGGSIAGVQVLERCRISDNTSTEPGAGIHVSRNLQVLNCVIYNNQSTHPKAASAIYVMSPNNYFQNCDIIHNQGGVYIEESFAYEKASSPLLTNCVLWRNKTNIINPSNCNYQLSACAIEGGTGIPELDAERGILSLSSENEGTNPQENYICYGDGFELLPTSCLINRGKPIQTEERDYLNRPRNALGNYDIGAIEYQGIYQWVEGAAPLKIQKEVFRLASTTFNNTTYYALVSPESVKKESGKIQIDHKAIHLGRNRNAYTLIAGTPFIALFREGKKGEKSYCNILEWNGYSWEFLIYDTYTAEKGRPILKKHPSEKGNVYLTHNGRTTLIDVYRSLVSR